MPLPTVEVNDASEALHDGLTGLANRMLLRQQLERALLELGGRAVALLFLDLDGFKRVNDELGHRAGDELLQAVAGRLTATVPRTDAVARLAGDEFVVLLRSVPGEQVPVEVARRLLQALAAPFEVGGQPVHIGASIGIALAWDGTCRPEDLLRSADQAMYQAKKAGKGSYMLAPPARVPSAP